MAKDPKDFGDVPQPTKGFKLPTELPSDKTALLALVAAKGNFPPRAARWLATREVHALLADGYPIEVPRSWPCAPRVRSRARTTSWPLPPTAASPTRPN